MVNTPQDADLTGESSVANGPDVSAGRLKFEALTQPYGSIRTRANRLSSRYEKCKIR